MDKLRGLQFRFQNYLRDGANQIEDDIVNTENARAEHRLGTYYNAYRIRLIEILANDYTALAEYLGRETFENLALDYLHHHPSQHPSARWFGEHFAGYINSCKSLTNPEFCHEMAYFEWTRGLVFDARDAGSSFKLEDMAQVAPQAWPSIRIQFQPALRWLDLYWNVCPIAVALIDQEPAPAEQRNQFPQRWLLWRQQRDPYWRSLEAQEAWALERAQAGDSFAELCEGLCEWLPEQQVALCAAGFLKQWINDEMVARLDYEL